MKKLFLLLLLAGLGVALYRRATRSHGAPSGHQHGTPDHWPPVVRKPGTERAPAA